MQQQGVCIVICNINISISVCILSLATQPPPMPQSLNSSTVSRTSIVTNDDSPSRVQSHDDFGFINGTANTSHEDTDISTRTDFARQLSSQSIDSRERMPSPTPQVSNEADYSRDLDRLRMGGQHVPMLNGPVSSSPDTAVGLKSVSPEVARVPNYQTDTGDTYASILPRKDRLHKDGLVSSQQAVEANANNGSYIPKSLGRTMTATYTNGDTTVVSPIQSVADTASVQSSGPITSYLESRAASSSESSVMKPIPYKDHVLLHNKVPSSPSGRKLPQPNVLSSLSSSTPPPDPGYATIGSVISGTKVGSANQKLSGQSSPEVDLKLPGEVLYVTIRKRKGLGVSVIGGTDHQEGPHIYVENVVDELDAFHVSY